MKEEMGRVKKVVCIEVDSEGKVGATLLMERYEQHMRGKEKDWSVFKVTMSS